MNAASTTINTAIGVNPDGIPDEQKTYNHWVIWRLEKRENDWTKVPYDPKNPDKHASTTDSRTWASFSEALGAFETRLFSGLGFVFSSGDPFVGIDFDKCRNPETGEVDDAVLEYAKKFEDAYLEVSASGTGVHLITRGKLRGASRRGKVEMYDQERFFAMTGVLIDAR